MADFSAPEYSRLLAQIKTAGDAGLTQSGAAGGGSATPAKFGGIFPSSGVAPDNTVNAEQRAAVMAGCKQLFYSLRCSDQVDPLQANAIISELANLIISSGLQYDCTRLDNLAIAIQQIIDNRLYGCVNFPVMDTKKYSNPIIPLAAAKNTETGCMEIVQNPSGSRWIGSFSEAWRNPYSDKGSLFPIGPSGASDDTDGSNLYSVKELADSFRSLVPPGDSYPFAVNLQKDGVQAGRVDAAKLNRSLIGISDFTLNSPLDGMQINLGFIVAYNKDALSLQNVSYIIFAVDDVIHLAADGLIENGDYQVVPQRQGTENDTLYNGSYATNSSEPWSAGKHTLKAYIFPQIDFFKNPMTKIYLEGGRAPYGTPMYRFSATVMVPLS